MTHKKIIIGFDPGTNKMGYGVLEVEGKKLTSLAMGYIELSKFTTPYLKLRHIYERVEGIVAEYKPYAVAFEAPFYGENVQSMLKLGRAQGVAIAAATRYTSEIYEYSPRKIKIAITGGGAATKEQVAAMIKNTLKLDSMPDNLDASDGMAAALCHYYQTLNPFSTNRGSSDSWSSFIKKNPERVKRGKTNKIYKNEN